MKVRVKPYKISNRIVSERYINMLNSNEEFEVREDTIGIGGYSFLLSDKQDRYGLIIVMMEDCKIIGIDFRIGSSYCSLCKKVYETGSIDHCCRNSHLIEFFPGTVRESGFDVISDNIVSECFEGI